MYETVPRACNALQRAGRRSRRGGYRHFVGLSCGASAPCGPCRWRSGLLGWDRVCWRPIRAMLVLAVGGAGPRGRPSAGGTRRLVGAAVGSSGQLRGRPAGPRAAAGEAIGQVAWPADEFLRGWRGIAHGLVGAAAHAAERGAGARRTSPGRTVRRARRAERAAQPRSGEVREAQPRLRTSMTGIELCYILMRTCAASSSTYVLPAERQGVEAYSPRTGPPRDPRMRRRGAVGVADVAAGTVRSTRPVPGAQKLPGSGTAHGAGPATAR